MSSKYVDKDCKVAKIEGVSSWNYLNLPFIYQEKYLPNPTCSRVKTVNSSSHCHSSNFDSLIVNPA